MPVINIKDGLPIETTENTETIENEDTNGVYKPISTSNTNNNCKGFCYFKKYGWVLALVLIIVLTYILFFKKDE